MGVQPELVALQFALEAFAGIVALAVTGVWQTLADNNVSHLQPK